ncbi:MAG: hypothetical protein AAFO29_09845, partial [Actinomycetota bacterium]
FVAAIGWWLLTVGFARYVDLTSNANEVQAVVGASLLALTWVWVAAQVLLVGGAVNYLLGERLGVTRGRRTWAINEVVTKGTGEIKKIVVPDRAEPAATTPPANGQPGPAQPAAGQPTPSQPANGSPVNGAGQPVDRPQPIDRLPGQSA